MGGKGSTGISAILLADILATDAGRDGPALTQYLNLQNSPAITLNEL